MKTNEKMDSGHTLRAVGIIRSSIKEPFLKPDETGIRVEDRLEEIKKHIHEIKETRCRIIIDPERTALLKGIESYSHLVVLYWAHQVPEANRSIDQVHPMGRKEIPRVGIFCTSSPVRPNPVLTTVVRLVARRGNTLEVTGLDAVDKSPVIDIKPYVRNFYPEENIQIPEWMTRLIAEMNP